MNFARAWRFRLSRTSVRLKDETRGLVISLALIEVFFLALFAIAPVGGLALTRSPLAVAWPWLLAPGRVIFGNTLIDSNVYPENAVPALLLFATLLVGASCAAAVALTRVGAGVLIARAARGDRRLLALALGGAVLLGLTLVLLPALPSDDVFSYILYGRISAVHHANPLVAVPSNFPHDPFLWRVYWQNTRSVYGPVWLLLSDWVSQVAEVFGGSLAMYVGLFKLLGLAAHVANAALIWAILGIIAPRRRLLGTLLYAWNPLALLEFCASAHNDVVMLTLLLAAVYCIARGWDGLGLIALGLSIGTKYMPIVLLPFLLVWFWRRDAASGYQWRTRLLHGLWSVTVIVGVLGITALPFWDGTRILGALLYSPPAQSLDNSFIDALQWPLRGIAQGLFGMSANAARIAVDGGLKDVALGLFGLLWLWELRRARDLSGVVRAWGWVLLWYVLVASGWFWPWYVTWALVVVALVPWGPLPAATLLTAGGALTLYAFLPLHASAIYGFRSGFAFMPAFAYLGARAWRELRAGWRPVAPRVLLRQLQAQLGGSRPSWQYPRASGDVAAQPDRTASR